MLEFLPLVARDSIPSSQLAWHSYVKAPSPFRPLQLLHDRDVVAGRRAAETAGCDALSLGRNSNARSRQDLRPRMLHCLTNVTIPQRPGKINNDRCNAVDVVCFGDLVTDVQVYYNQLSIQPEWIMLHVHCTDVQRNRGTCAVYQ